MVTANIGLTLPASGVASWDSPLNSNFNLLDLHDHSSGKGARVPTSGLNLNADVEFNGYRASELRALVFNSASSEASVQSYSLYTVSGELYYKKAGTAPVQITNAGAVNAATTGGFGTGYSGVAIAVYDSSNARYIFKASVDNDTSFDNHARIAGSAVHTYNASGGPSILFDTGSATSNFRLGKETLNGNLILSSGAISSDAAYAAALTTVTNIMEISPAGNIGVGTNGGGTTDKFTVRAVSAAASTDTSVGNVTRFVRGAENTTGTGFGARIPLYLKIGSGSDTEVGRIDWLLGTSATTRSHLRFWAYESSAIAEALRLGARCASPVEIGYAADVALNVPAGADITSASDGTSDIGASGQRFNLIWCSRLIAGDLTSVDAPSSATNLVTRHGYNCILAWGQVSSTGSVGATHYNVSAAVRSADPGVYDITFDAPINIASVIQANCEDAVSRTAVVNWTDTSNIRIRTYDTTTGNLANSDFHFAVIGRPSGTP